MMLVVLLDQAYYAKLIVKELKRDEGSQQWNKRRVLSIWTSDQDRPILQETAVTELTVARLMGATEAQQPRQRKPPYP
eukprot:2857723-Amphidinium_carterae.1